MANSQRRTISYKPRFTDEEAYERLPPTLKRALQNAVTEWSAAWTLRSFNKRGLQKTLDALKAGDETFMRKGWIPAKGKRPALASSFVSCRVKPLRNCECRA